MLSDETFNFLSAKPDVDDHEIDALVRYAAKERPDAWKAIQVMHKRGQDQMVAEYLMMLNDQKLTALGNVLPYLWARFDAYEERQRKLEAEADAQPEAMRQQASLQEKMSMITIWMRQQDVDVCTTTICHSIEATAKANKVRCKQDWAGIVRLIRDEGAWINGFTNEAFVQLVSTHCHISKSLKPSEPTLKVLSFGSTKFPAWKVANYDLQQLDNLMQMAIHFVSHLYNQVQQAIILEQQKATSGIIRLT